MKKHATLTPLQAEMINKRLSEKGNFFYDADLLVFNKALGQPVNCMYCSKPAGHTTIDHDLYACPECEVKAHKEANALEYEGKRKCPDCNYLWTANRYRCSVCWTSDHAKPQWSNPYGAVADSSYRHRPSSGSKAYGQYFSS